MRIAVYPGTFDPLTFGHIDVIERSLKIADKLVVAVAYDTGKQTIFNQMQRCQIIEQALAEQKIPQGAVEVKTFSGLLVNFASSIGAGVIVRGLRAISDYEYEFQMSCMNMKMNASLETIFLPASERTHFISSRMVKEIARLGGDISNLAPPASSKALKEYYQT